MHPKREEGTRAHVDTLRPHSQEPVKSRSHQFIYDIINITYL